MPTNPAKMEHVVPVDRRADYGPSPVANVIREFVAYQAVREFNADRLACDLEGRVDRRGEDVKEMDQV